MDRGEQKLKTVIYTNSFTSSELKMGKHPLVYSKENSNIVKSREKFKNWINVRMFKNLNDTSKRGILKSIETKQQTDKECPLSDIYRLRAKILVSLAFPTGGEFPYLRDYSPTCSTNFPEREKKIYNNFMCSYNYLENGDVQKAMSTFTRADMEFGVYRHEKWLTKK